VAKLAHYCCDPRFHPEPRLITALDEPCQECDPNWSFYGSKVQAEQKRERLLKMAAEMQKNIVPSEEVMKHAPFGK